MEFQEHAIVKMKIDRLQKETSNVFASLSLAPFN
jgi:hypothetical protein